MLLAERRADIALASAAFDMARSESPAQIALLGTGTVGSAVLARLEHLRSHGLHEHASALHLVAVANTRSLRLLPGAHQACVANDGNGQQSSKGSWSPGLGAHNVLTRITP